MTTLDNVYTTANAIKDLIQTWDKTMEAAKQQFPNASSEELYQIVKTAMCKSLNL